MFSKCFSKTFGNAGDYRTYRIAMPRQTDTTLKYLLMTYQM